MSQEVENKTETTETNDADINRRSYLKMVGGSAGLATGLGASSAGLATVGSDLARADHTSQYTIIDDFEDGSLSEYNFDRGSSGASIVSSPAYNGSNALEISNTNTEMISTSGLNSYPEAGDTFRYWVRATGGADDINLTYGVQDHDNRYFVRVDFANDNLRLYIYENGSATQLDKQTSGFTLAEDTWYQVEIDWDREGGHTATLSDTNGGKVAQVSDTDSTWTSGGIGYDAYLGSSGGSVYFDYISSGEVDGCLTIDDFEDFDLSEYQFDRGQSSASVVSSPTYSGSHALAISGTNTEMISMEGLEFYPSAGDIFRTWVRGTNGADRINITYGVQNHTNRYFARVNPEQGHVALYRYEDGSGTLLADKSVQLSQDTWYEVEIDWQTDGTHIFTLSDSSGSQISQISATDSTWEAGGIGFDAYLGDGGTVYIDKATIESGSRVLPYNRVIDSFEDGDLSEYSFDRGQTGASVVQGPTYGGSSVLMLSNDDTEMISTSGLEYYPAAGDVFSAWVRGTDGAEDINFTYGVQDHDNRYLVRVDLANDELEFWRHEGGQSYVLSSQTSGFTLSEDAWYNIDVDWRNPGTHIITLYDCTGNQLAQIEGTDTAWASGGIGYDAYLGDGGTVYFDQVTRHLSVVDDFEDGDISEYSGDTGSFTVQNNTVLERNYTLKGSSSPSAVAHTGMQTPRGHVYGVSVLAESGSGTNLALLTCVQDPAAPLDNCYALVAEPANDTLSLYRYDNGSSVLLEQTSVTLDEGNEYQLIMELQTTDVLGAIQNAAGDELAATGAIDTSYSDGHLGVSVDGGAPGYFDYVTKRATQDTVLDNFEDGNLTEYAGNTGSYSVQSATVLEGQYSLECDTKYTKMAHTSVTTNRGNEYRCNFIAGSDSLPGLLTCVQDPNNPMEDCYWVRADPANDALTLYRRESGSSVQLDSMSVALHEGTEYRLALQLRENAVRAKVYSEQKRLLAATDVITDTTYVSGYVGFYTGRSAPAYYDYVLEVPLAQRTRVEVSTTTSAAKAALDSPKAQDVLTELNNPSTDTSNATQKNAYFQGDIFQAKIIDVPIEYGNLELIYQNGVVKEVVADLDRSTVSDSLISDLSDDFGWPTSESGTVTYADSLSEPKFSRTVTDSERSDVKTLVNDYDNRNDEPYAVIVRNNDGGVYRAVYKNKIYHTDETISTVTKEIDLIRTPNRCRQLGINCWLNIAVTWGSCSPALLIGCLASGPLTPATCPLAFLLCGGSAWSGIKSCRKYRRRCSRKSRRRSRRRRKRRRKRRR